MVESTSASSNNSNVYSTNAEAEEFTIEMARNMKAPTEKLLCSLKDNDKIGFGEFTIRDYDSRTVL